MPFSILLLTYNEQVNLATCLDAIKWCDDIVILDSFSTDHTLEIAKRMNVRVYQRKFDNFSCQRNYAINTFSFKHEWIFHLDADEIITEELRYEIEKNIITSSFDGYLVPSKMIFMGRWLRYSAMYPTYQVRLGKINRLKFKQVGHGQKEDISPDKLGKLDSPYLHYSFNQGIHAWIEKHNRYSSDEAKIAVSYRRRDAFEWRGVFTRDAYRRRAAIKKLSYQVPFRSFFRFLYMYFFKLGFLDGKEGLLYCQLVAIYELLIEIKIYEMENKDDI